MTTLSPTELASARARTWALLGHVLIEGPTPRVREALARLPALASHLPPVGDEAFAAHHQLFGLELSPHESAFRSHTGQLGTSESVAVSDTFARVGFDHGRTDLEPDHVGLQCLAMSFLAGAEADAREDGLTQVADRVVALQEEVLGRHLLRWLPLLVVAVERAEGGLYAEGLGLALELAVSHGTPVVEDEVEATDLLAEERTGLKDVATALSVPVRSGWYLGQGAMGRIARASGVPHGFGSRRQRLEALLFGGVEHGRLPQVLDALDDEARAWEQALGAWGRAGAPVTAWQARLGHTRGLLATLSGAADALGRDDLGAG